MLHLYSLIWYKYYVNIVSVISGCFCSYSIMKLLYSVVCISIILFCIATILSLYEVSTNYRAVSSLYYFECVI